MSESTPIASAEYRILALYRFVPLVALPELGNNDPQPEPVPDPERHPALKSLQRELYDALRPWQVRGTLLLAPEGINGTICYPFHAREDVDAAASDDPVFEYLKGHALFGGPDLRTRLSVWTDCCDGHEEESDDGASNNDVTHHEHTSSQSAQKKIHQLKQPQQAFQRLKIKIKAEIVTMGLGRPLGHYSRGAEDFPSLQRCCDVKNGASAHQTSQLAETARSTSPLSRHLQNQRCNPLLTKGQYLSPSQWDSLCIADPDVLVIDTRNTYEVEIGTFDRAIDPKTNHFAEFPNYLERLAWQYDWSAYKESNSGQVESGERAEMRGGTGHGEHSQGGTEKRKVPPKAIAMFCTGGIRCEKATSYALQSHLFPKNMPIYHLEGGILAYLDYVAKQKRHDKGSNYDELGGADTSRPKSTFHGECFVFDKRVAVTEGLRPSKNYIPCYGCRGPMDRRLLLSANENTSGDKSEAAECKQSSIPSKYQTLMQGIPNLPELHYDPFTKQYYLPGLTCPRCHDGTTRESLERFAQRKEQMEICEREGKSHFRDGKLIGC
ncbi:hypothetical protein HJC23_003400 [Cyclotella cryptica]|uniref:Rhodanese domain-containing protein n=1 Tax=Cyclotella cryptica TaxID=29204 RepID=A0ABD3QRU2_9STRA